MADSKISALTALTSLADADEMVVASSGASKKITGANLRLSNNYALLSRTVLGSDTASFDITSISGAYNHLRVLLMARYDGAGGATTVLMRLNNDSGSNYSYNNTTSTSGGILNNGSTGGTSARIGAIPGSSQTANMVCCVDLTIFDYALTTFAKTWAGVGGRTDANSGGNLVTETPFGNWNSTAAVTRITAFPGSGNFKTGSTFTIYGLL